MTPPFRSGYVAIIGEPNVGKSTLMNTLLQQKISIVTNKPQTTRHKILGILTTEQFQMIFLDTPGLITPKYLLQETMVESAVSAIGDADVILLMVSATDPKIGSDPGYGKILAMLRGLGKPVFLVINKVDLVEKPSILPMIQAHSRTFPYREIFPISARTADNTGALLNAIIPHLPVHPPFYPADIVSEQSERFFVSEIVREKIFLVCHEEIPYSTSVDVVEFREREEGKSFISAEIYVERESQKGILIGRKGAMLAQIGRMARPEIEKFLGYPVYLDLHVKVRKEWRGDETWLARLGYKPRG